MKILILSLVLLPLLLANSSSDDVCGSGKRFSHYENECTAICMKSVEIGMDIREVPVKVVPVGADCKTVNELTGKCRYVPSGPVSGECFAE